VLSAKWIQAGSTRTRCYPLCYPRVAGSSLPKSTPDNARGGVRASCSDRPGSSKTALRERLICLCRDAKLTDRECLADEVFLLCEGARITAQSVGSEGLSSRLTGMLEALVADHARRDKPGELHRGITHSRR
jgi:hypothetical protein